MGKIAIFETYQLSLKKTRLSIERPPHFCGKIYDQWDIFPDAWENMLEAEEIEDEEMRK
jgi:hypothetical protein